VSEQDGRGATSKVARILLVRHGQSDWNATGRWQGQADPPLSALGERQAHHAGTAAELATLDTVEASDLERARRTAELAVAGRVELRCDVRWRERHAGVWQGLTRDEIDAGWPGFLARGARPEGWEHDDDLYARATGALMDLAHRAVGGVALVVTHGGVIRTVERRLGAPGELVPNLGARWLTVEDGALALGERTVLVDDAEITIPSQF